MRLSIISLVLLSACSSSPAVSDVMFEAVAKRASEVEDHREFQEPFFKAWAESTDPRFRARAALALGRLMNPKGIPYLDALAADDDPVVRRSALFAAGQMGLAAEPLAPANLERLIKAAQASLRHEDETVRAAAIEALGKLATAQAPPEAVAMLQDKSPVVRRQAASACFRWRRSIRMRDPEAKPGDLAKEVGDALSAAAADADPEVRWRAVHALHQTAAKPSLALLGRFLQDSEPLARLFALNIVERHKLKEFEEPAVNAQRDGDPSVRVAAIRAVRALESGARLDLKLVADPSHHVREALASALESEGPELETLSKDSYTAVRAAALLTRARLSEEKAPEILLAALSDPDPGIREAAVRGASGLKEKGLPVLLKARQDKEHENVRAAALVVLGPIEGSEALDEIRQGLGAPGLAERGNAVTALDGRKEDVVADAIKCFENSGDRKFVEIREELVGLLGKRAPESTTEFLRRVAGSDEAPSVRQRAVTVLRKRGITDLPDAPSVRTVTPYMEMRFVKNPIVLVETTKGVLEIECYPAHAPVHVANFVGLVEKGFYNGLAWHRVVPNFVIQGGDPDNSGWGDAGWSLRAEVNPVPYERGTLGMPRSAGFDTGGCQIFITHIPTPHLDGYYTVFGKVTKGLDVVDKIEVGDKIISAKLKP